MARAALAAALAVAAVLKARHPGEARAGLKRLGVPSGAPALAVAICVEAVLALAVAAGFALAAYAAAALMVALAAVLAVALARGRGGEPCPCFGPSGAIGRRALV